MAISNTSILIKRSYANAKPSNLNAGEFAYSYKSNTLFFGTPDGTGVVNVGGQYYTSTLDAATNVSTPSTLVKRDTNGAFYGALFGNSNTATTLLNGRNFNISGGDITSNYVGFDGSSGVTLNASLNSIAGLTEGFYGGSTPVNSTIPVIHVSANGRIMSISNTTVTSSFTLTDGTNSTVFNSGNTLSVLANHGIVSTVSQNQIYLSTDNTILRSNTTSVGPQQINTDLTVFGNLNVLGAQTSFNIWSTTVRVGDGLIELAANNIISDVTDIGFYGASNPSGSQVQYHGLVREGTGGPDAGKFYLFHNSATNPTGNNVNYASLSRADFVAGNGNFTSLNISGSTTYNTANVTNDFGVGGNTYLTGNEYVGGSLNVTGVTTLTGQANTVHDLGVGGNSYVAGNQVVTGTTTLVGQANTTNDLGVAGNIYTTNAIVATKGLYSRTNYTGPYSDGIVVDYVSGTGRLSVGSADGITFYNNTDTSRVPIFNVTSSGVITTGTWQSTTIGIGYGGTNNTSFNNQTITYFDGTKIASLPNVAFTATGTGASNNTITSVTVDNFGRTSALTYTQISGLTVPQGGTGFATAALNGIVYGNNGGALQVTAAAGSNDQTWSNQIMTVTNSGVPTWSSALDGGTF